MNNHDRFLSHLDESAGAVWMVAQWLNGKGYHVSVPPATRAERHADWRSHADEGDLHISHRIEVKRLSRNFTSADDWPFGRHFIVCAKHAFDRAAPKPFAFFILSSNSRCAAVVMASDSPNWTVETRKDARYDDGVSQEFYFCPLPLVSFVRLDAKG